MNTYKIGDTYWKVRRTFVDFFGVELCTVRTITQTDKGFTYDGMSERAIYKTYSDANQAALKALEDFYTKNKKALKEKREPRDSR